MMTTSLIESIKRRLRPAKPFVLGAVARIKHARRKAVLELKIAGRPTLLRSRLRFFLASGRRIVIRKAASPELTVVIIVHERADLTLACLESIVSGGVENFELIIVDNASTDRTRDLLGKIEDATIIRTEARLTPLEAGNRAASRARGAFLAFIDPDCLIAAGSIAAALDLIRSRP
jgi:hypothetical protein